MQIYIHHNGKQLGPLTEAEVKAQLASGALLPTDHVWWQGQTGWIPLSQSSLWLVPPPPPPALPGAPVPLAGPHSSYEKTSNLALWSLICGVCSFFCGLLFIPAIVLGHLGLSETKRNPAIKGRGLALTGMILGYVVLAILIFSLIVMSIFMALGNQVSGTLKSIELKSLQSLPSQDDSDNDQSTNSPDQSTNSAPASNPSDSSTNSPPVITP